MEVQYHLGQGSCLDPESYPGNKKADLVLFDPPFWPYQIAYKQIRKETEHKLKPIQTPEGIDYPRFWRRTCELAKDHMKKSAWFCFKSDGWTAKLTFPITKEYFTYSNEVIWDKMRIGLGRRIRTQHEQIECYTYGPKAYWGQEMLKSSKRKGVSLEGEETEYKIKGWHGGSQGKAFASIIRVPNYNSGTLGKKGDTHINQTPPQVWEKFLKYMCPPDGLVLDLTAGTFSIAQACIKLNRLAKYDFKYWGIEIDPWYVKEAKKRLLSNPLGAFV